VIGDVFVQYKHRVFLAAENANVFGGCHVNLFVTKVQDDTYVSY